MATVRIVTVTATGEKYIYKYGDTNVVVCWGELVSYRGLNTKHSGTKNLYRKDVTISDVERTPLLIEEMFQQYIRSEQKAGKYIVWKGRRFTIYNSRDEYDKLQELRAMTRRLASGY